MIESFTFTNLGTNSSLAFNNSELPFHTMDIERERRMDIREKARKHGLWPTYQYFGGMTLRCEGSILQVDSAAYLQKRLALQEVLRPTPHLGNLMVGRLEVQFTGMETVYADCTLDGDPELPVEALFPSSSDFMITWLAFDPLFYSSAMYEAEIGTPGITPGDTFPMTFPLSFGGVSGPNDILIDNIGNMETLPVIEIHGPVTSPILKLVHNAGEFEFMLDGLIIPAGDFATVDFKARTVRSDIDEADWYEFATGKWWALEPGNNEVHFTAFDASAPAKAVVKWNHAYLV